MTATVLRGDALRLPLADETVDLVVTSPPYFGLRSYTDGGQHYAGQVGDEATPAEYVDALLAATREMVRVLKPSGSIWVNLGDKYSGSGPGPGQAGFTKGGSVVKNAYGRERQGLLPQTDIRSKSLLGIPWRYAIACIDQLGLILRAEIIWSKPNGLPESVTDRVRRSHEQWFHLVKQPRYYSAVDEIREEHIYPGDERWKRQVGGDYAKPMSGYINGALNPLGKLPGSVWTIPTEPLQVPAHLGVDHFAAFPTEWPRRIIAGWSPPGICVECGEGRRPVASAWAEGEQRDGDRFEANSAALGRPPINRAAFVTDVRRTITGYVCACTPRTDHPGTGEPHRNNSGVTGGNAGTHVALGTGRPSNLGSADKVGPWREYHHDRWTPAPTRPATVLDPFGGTGTTALVADILGRHGISVDLSADYNRLATWRTRDPGQRARAARVDKPPPVIDGQLDLFAPPPPKGATMVDTRPMKGDWADNWGIVEAGLIPDYTKTAQLLLPGAPVEWAGKLADGRHWYFRARHEHCGLGVGATQDEAIDNQRADHHVPGGEFSASYLSPEDTLAWLRRLLAEVRP